MEDTLLSYQSRSEKLLYVYKDPRVLCHPEIQITFPTETCLLREKEVLQNFNYKRDA